MCFNALSKFFSHVDLKNPPDNPWSPFAQAILHNRKDYLKNLLKNLKKLDKNCIGFKDKLDDIRSYRKIDTFLSECKFGLYYIDSGCSVEFIKDNDSRFSGPSPDLIIEKDEHVAFIEVRYVGDRDKTHVVLIEGLRKILKGVKNPVIVSSEIEYEHEELFNYPDKLLEKIKISLSRLHALILSNQGKLPAGKHKFGIVTYFVEEYEGNKAIPATFSPSETWEIKVDLFENIIRKVLEEKANKSEKWKNHINYYIGIDLYLSFYYPEDLGWIVYGKTVEYAKEWENIPGWKFDESVFPEVKTAAKNGWKKFLKDVYLIPHDMIRVDEKGLFLTFDITQAISGILLIKKKIPPIVFPNPFSKKDRQDLDYYWLGESFKYK